MIVRRLIGAVAATGLLLAVSGQAMAGAYNCPAGFLHGAGAHGDGLGVHGTPSACITVPRAWNLLLGTPAGAASASGTCSGGSAPSSTTRGPCESGGGTFTPTTAATDATGIYEFNSVVQAAIPVVLLITILWAGLMITRRVIRSFRGA